jgi:hypothetical protein
MLITKWFADPLRPTQDLDLLGFGDADPDKMVTTFQEICAVPFDDAVVFDIEAVEIDRMREELEYGGLRIKTNATVDGARVRVVIDIGFGDATEPGLTEMDLPVLLDFPAPHLRAYARETVIAEKFQAMVALGRANSRMKDLYDIWVLSRTHEFKGDSLARDCRDVRPPQHGDPFRTAGCADARLHRRPRQDSAVEFVCGRCGVSARLPRRGDSRFGGISYAARSSRACPRRSQGCMSYYLRAIPGLRRSPVSSHLTHWPIFRICPCETHHGPCPAARSMMGHWRSTHPVSHVRFEATEMPVKTPRE